MSIGVTLSPTAGSLWFNQHNGNTFVLHREAIILQIEWAKREVQIDLPIDYRTTRVLEINKVAQLFGWPVSLHWIDGVARLHNELARDGKFKPYRQTDDVGGWTFHLRVEVQ